MKRLDLVQLTIMLVGIISAYFAMTIVPQFIVFMITWFTDGLRGGYFMTAFINVIIMLAIYLLFAIYTIKNSKQLAQLVTAKADFEAGVNFALDKHDLLYLLFTGLGLYGLIEHVPGLFTMIIDYAKGHDGANGLQGSLLLPNKPTLLQKVIITGLYLVLFIYAQTFAGMLSARIMNTEPEDEIANNIAEQ